MIMTSFAVYYSLLCLVTVLRPCWAEIQHGSDTNSADVKPTYETPLLRQYTCGSTSPVYVGPGYQVGNLTC